MTATGGAWVGGPGELKPAAQFSDRLPLPLSVILAATGVLLLLAEAAVRTLMEE